MQHPTYQTVSLSKGGHASPDDGVCVMELASMLSGETFSAHPRCVSWPIASFLRTYNDVLDDARRQDLYAYAAKVVGTAGCPEHEAARSRRLVEWADARWDKRPRWWPHGWLRRRPALTSGGPKDYEQAARYALESIRTITDATHASVLSLLDELVSIGNDRPSSQAVDRDVSPQAVMLRRPSSSPSVA